MPLYTYKCRVCHQTFDKVQGMDEKTIEVIDHEHKGKRCQGFVFRVIGKSAVHFKGSGFYKTDYSLK
jgi:putative FmdB family regulatory protein